MRAFVASSISLVMIFAAAGAPLPLYESYRVEDGLRSADLALTTVMYFVMVLASLLTLGRLSDHLGRRRVGLTALAVATAGSVVLLEVHGVGTLAAGRALQGIACGLAVTSLGSYIVDTAPARPRWLAANTAATAPLIGLTIGPLGAGALAHYSPLPKEFVFVAAAGLLLLSAVLILFSPESATRHPGAWKSLRPSIRCPRPARLLLPAAAAVYIATWALGGFYQAFSPTIMAETLNTDNTLVQASMFVAFMAPSIVGGPLTSRLSSVNAQRVGITLFAVSVVGVVVSLWTDNIVAVLLASAVAGIGQGASMTGSMRGLMAATSAQQRAGTLATIYLVSYSAAAVPSLIAGQLSKSLDIDQLAVGYAALAVVACLAALGLSRRSSQPDDDAAPRQTAEAPAQVS